MALSPARKDSDGLRAGDSEDRGRILSIGRRVQKGFLEEMTFELSLHEMGRGHRMKRKSGLGL